MIRCTALHNIQLRTGRSTAAGSTSVPTNVYFFIASPAAALAFGAVALSTLQFYSFIDSDNMQSEHPVRCPTINIYRRRLFSFSSIFRYDWLVNKQILFLWFPIDSDHLARISFLFFLNNFKSPNISL